MENMTFLRQNDSPGSLTANVIRYMYQLFLSQDPDRVAY